MQMYEYFTTKMFYKKRNLFIKNLYCFKTTEYNVFSYKNKTILLNHKKMCVLFIQINKLLLLLSFLN